MPRIPGSFRQTDSVSSVAISGPVFRAEKYGITLPTGSDLGEPLNEILLQMYQDGTLDEIYARWFQ